MSPETYYKVVLLLLARDSVALGFSLANFFANGGKEILINSAAQYGGLHRCYSSRKFYYS